MRTCCYLGEAKFCPLQRKFKKTIEGCAGRTVVLGGQPENAKGNGFVLVYREPFKRPNAGTYFRLSNHPPFFAVDRSLAGVTWRPLSFSKVRILNCGCQELLKSFFILTFIVDSSPSTSHLIIMAKPVRTIPPIDYITERKLALRRPSRQITGRDRKKIKAIFNPR